MVIPPKEEQMCHTVAGFPGVASYPEIFVSKTGKKDNQKVHYYRQLNITEASTEREGETSDAGDRQQQQDTSCCSHSFASFLGFRKYPMVADGKRWIKTPIRVAAVAETRRRETVKRTPCVGVLLLASCCLSTSLTELSVSEMMESVKPGKIKAATTDWCSPTGSIKIAPGPRRQHRVGP
ncbi:hypothetical protein D9C73_027119 [Collichthys lucidus]|uniref:Uncharacterized protein n=1 Tax=Collichthys lucidus TaxID=240159 RepID=A0A4U5VVS2_COLLU|nr:hypothetical protein D9C73_027119 [Collichthys lucidus]